MIWLKRGVFWTKDSGLVPMQDGEYPVFIAIILDKDALLRLQISRWTDRRAARGFAFQHPPNHPTSARQAASQVRLATAERMSIQVREIQS
jgi:hypothetical protein